MDVWDQEARRILHQPPQRASEKVANPPGADAMTSQVKLPQDALISACPPSSRGAAASASPSVS
jgi:hypothetical protein